MSKIINPLHFAFFVAARLVLLVGPRPYLSDFVSHGGGGGESLGSWPGDVPPANNYI